jgi:hypothetical protein
MQFYAAGSPPPSTASTIFTVTQQAGIMAGTGITGMVGTTGPTQTGATQTFASSDMTITSAANTHTFAIPSAGIATNGLVDTSAQTFTGVKSFGNGASAGEIRLIEPSGAGTNYIGLKAPATVAADTTFTLPNSDGTPGTVLQTNGSGILSWISNGGALSTQYLKNTTATTVTNPTVNTIVETLTIPAGTFSSNNAFMLNVKMRSTVATSAIAYTISVNTSAAIGGTNILNSTMSATNSAQNVILNLNLFGGISGSGTRYLQNGFTTSTNIGNETFAIDWSITQYIVFWVTGAPSLSRNVINVLIGTTPL